MTNDTGSSKSPTLATATSAAGHVSEIFCSVQGEGLFVGQRQIFFRTAGCGATCYWCDTPAAREQQERCVIHGATRQSVPNPISVDAAVKAVLALAELNRPVRAVSMTGGEPLEQADFVAGIAKALKARKMSVHLETSGLHVDGFRQVRPFVDVVSMDIKLPSATGRDHWDVHREFVKWLVGKTGFIKIVVDAPTPFEEIETAVHLIAEIDRSIPLVLMPESATFLKLANGPEAQAQLRDLLERGQRVGLECLKDVRIIPQCHKVLKVR
jgi:organic radical activating enzyme